LWALPLTSDALVQWLQWRTPPANAACQRSLINPGGSAGRDRRAKLVIGGGQLPSK